MQPPAAIEFRGALRVLVVALAVLAAQAELALLALGHGVAVFIQESPFLLGLSHWRGVVGLHDRIGCDRASRLAHAKAVDELIALLAAHAAQALAAREHDLERVRAVMELPEHRGAHEREGDLGVDDVVLKGTDVVEHLRRDQVELSALLEQLERGERRHKVGRRPHGPVVVGRVLERDLGRVLDGQPSKGVDDSLGRARGA